jgi:hypothetical protein
VTARVLAGPAALAAVALALLLALRPLSTSRALAIWIVLVAALALAALYRQGRARGAPRTSRFEAALRRSATPAAQPLELARMERELELGIASATHAHRRLLPLLRAAAAARLATRHGIEIDRRPEAARALLGPEVWELLRPDRPAPADRHGAGPSRETVVAAIEKLEAL